MSANKQLKDTFNFDFDTEGVILCKGWAYVLKFDSNLESHIKDRTDIIRRLTEVKKKRTKSATEYGHFDILDTQWSDMIHNSISKGSNFRDTLTNYHLETLQADESKGYTMSTPTVTNHHEADVLNYITGKTQPHDAAGTLVLGDTASAGAGVPAFEDAADMPCGMPLCVLASAVYSPVYTANGLGLDKAVGDS